MTDELDRLLDKHRDFVDRVLAESADESDDLTDLTEPDEDDGEVRSWSELADEFADQAASCMEKFHEAQAMPARDAPFKTGRSAISWLTLSEGYTIASERVRYLIPRLAREAP